MPPSSGQQRPVGLWQAEWHALPALFGLASGALREARRLAESLHVDARRMRANLDITNGLIFADAAAGALAGKMGRGAAQAMVTKAAAKRARHRRAAARGARRRRRPRRLARQRL